MKRARVAVAHGLGIACVAVVSACAGALESRSCLAGPADLAPLVLADGLQAYVEPLSLLRVGPSVVVVGTPTYTWDVTGEQARMVASRKHIAAYLDEDAPRLIAKPIDVPIGMTRAVALDECRWGVLFAEAEEIDSTAATVGFVGLWYAEYDGARWGEAERLPLPEDEEVSLVVSQSSPLVRFDGGLSWAVTDVDRGTYRYQRRGGTWRLEVAEPRGGEAASLATDEAGLWLAVSGLDPAISEPRKSIRLYRWRDGWSLAGRYPTLDTYTEIRRPELLGLPAGVTLTWVETPPSGDDLARAVVGIGPAESGHAVVIDRGGQRVDAVGLPDGAPAWVVLHPPELRLIDLEQGRPRALRSLPYPYTGWFAATPIGPREVLVTGPEFNPDPAHASVRSLTLRLSPSCN